MERLDLRNIISNVDESKCRFLYCRRRKLYITDLGTDCIYILDLVSRHVRVLGQDSLSKGQKLEPAGIVADRKGTVIVAHARSHRLHIFDRKRQHLGTVRVDKRLNRPSAMYLDETEPEPALFVCNLNANSVAKYTIQA